METQEDINKLADAIYKERLLRARDQDPCEKLMDGFRLFEEALVFTKAGVADELGTTDEDLIMAEVERRFELVRQMEDRGFYQPWPLRQSPS